MSLPSLSIKRPVFAWMLTLAIVIAGLLSLQKLGVGLYPDIDLPTVSVSVDYPGSSPELIETDITEVLEGALSSVQGVQAIFSESRFGGSRVTLEFDLAKNIDVAVQEVNTAIQGALRRLPSDAQTPVVSKSNPDDNPIIWVALSADAPLRELLYFAQNNVRDRLSTVKGVSDITLGGYVDPAIRVWLDVNRLNAYELSHFDIVNSIRTEHLEVPAGRIKNDQSETNVRFLGEAPSVKELADLPIVKRGGQSLYKRISIGELGKVEEGLAEIRRISRANGVRAIGLGIRKQRGSNAVTVADAVKARMKSMDLPKGYKFTVNFDSTREIKKSVHELNFTLILSATLTALVCWLFLGSLASTINIALAIPVSLLGTFIVFQWFGYTLNSFTMLGLILSIGIIVDDAIVVLENIFRVRESENDIKKAALRGAEEVQMAAIATTLSLLAVFLPIVFIDNIVGRYFAQFAVVLSVAVLWSTLEALTFTPMRMANFKSNPQMSGVFKVFNDTLARLSARYSDIIRKLMQSKFQGQWIYPLTIALFASSLLMIKVLPKELAPKEDNGFLMLRMDMPVGTSLEASDLELQKVEAALLKSPYVERIFANVGGFGGGGVHSSNIFITLKDLKLRKLDQTSVSDKLREDLKQVVSKRTRIFIMGRGGISLGGGHRSSDMDLKLVGSDWAELIAGSKALEKRLMENPSFQDVSSSYKDGSPEFAFIPNRSRALQSWVSVGDIGQTLAFLYNGITAAKFNDKGRRVDILVQATPESLPRKAEDFRRIFVRNSRSEPVPVNELVDFRDQSAPVSINRENRERTITLSASNATGTYLGSNLETAQKLAKETLPPSVRLNESGSAADLSKSFSGLRFTFLMGILAAYMVLASQFNSLLQPALILLSLPFSLSGAFLALWLAGSSLNIYSLIGLILLMGIVMKNGILLVEFANLERRHGKSIPEAVVAACRTRLRPIVMTAFTTMASAVLPAFKIGINSEASASMAIVVLGGLSVSTLVTLFLVPMAYFHFVKGDSGTSHA